MILSETAAGAALLGAITLVRAPPPPAPPPAVRRRAVGMGLGGRGGTQMRALFVEGGVTRRELSPNGAAAWCVSPLPHASAASSSASRTCPGRGGGGPLPAARSPRRGDAAADSQRQVTARLLQGLEEDDLTVADVLRALEDELKWSPLAAEFSALSPAPSPPVRSAVEAWSNATHAPAPLPRRARTPAAALASLRADRGDALGGRAASPVHPADTNENSPGKAPRTLRAGVLHTGDLDEEIWSSAPARWRADDFIANGQGCSQGAVRRERGPGPMRVTELGVEKHSQALGHALAGLSARLYGLLNEPLDGDSRGQALEIMMKHLTPCSQLDERVAAMCSIIDAKLGTTAGGTGAEGWRPIGVGRGAVVSADALDASAAFSATCERLPPRKPWQLRPGRPLEVVSAVVCLEGSVVGAKISGLYIKVGGVLKYGRSTYERAPYQMAFNGRAWTIHDKSNPDVVFAYAQDTAEEPYAALNQWRVARAEPDSGFEIDSHACVLPGESRVREVVLSAQRARSPRDVPPYMGGATIREPVERSLPLSSPRGRDIRELIIPRELSMLGMTLITLRGRPVVVDAVRSGGWADNASLRPGDELITVGDMPVADLLERGLLYDALQTRPQRVNVVRGTVVPIALAALREAQQVETALHAKSESGSESSRLSSPMRRFSDDEEYRSRRTPEIRR